MQLEKSRLDIRIYVLNFEKFKNDYRRRIASTK